MDDQRPFHQMLVADLLFESGHADAPRVAEALRSYWRQRTEDGATLAAQLDEDEALGALLPSIVEDADRMVRESGGDARRALQLRGGIDRTVLLALLDIDRYVLRDIFRHQVGARVQMPGVREGRYVELEPYEAGGQGVIYYAADTEMKRRVALKWLRPRGRGSADPFIPYTPLRKGEEPTALDPLEPLWQRFVQEARITGKLEHPGVVPVYELGLTPAGLPYYTMRFVEGHRTLATAIGELEEAPLETRLDLLESFLKICDTIAYAHAQGVLHRDLKPANVALGTYGEVVVLDWGLASMRPNAGEDDSGWIRQVPPPRPPGGDTHEAEGLGTPGYMSPEAARGRRDEMDERTDVYSLGVLLFEILTGRPPLAHSDPEYHRCLLQEDPPRADAVSSEIPKPLADICDQALARDVEHRLGTVRDLATRLRQWIARRAREREITVLHEHAQKGLELARAAKGSARMVSLEGVTAACAQIQRLDSAHAGALGAQREATELRERAVTEHAWAVGRRIAGVAAAILAIGLAIMLSVVEQKRRETVAALQRARVQGLVNASAAARADPTLSLLLARDAVRTEALTPAVARLREALAQSRARARLAPGGGALAAASFSQDGRLVVTPTETGQVMVWDRSGQPVAAVQAHAGPVSVARFLDNGTRLLTASRDGTARLWTAGLEPVAEIVSRGPPITHAALSPDAERIVLGFEDGRLRLTDRSGALDPTLDAHATAVTSVAFSADGSHFVSVAAAGPAGLWRRDGTKRAEVGEAGASISMAAFSPTDDHVITSGADGFVREWTFDGELVHSHGGHAAPVTMALYAPDGAWIASASEDGTVRVLDRTGRVRASLRGHTKGVLAISFAPGGRRLATASQDGTARIWSLDGDLEATLVGHGDWVDQVKYASDGATLLTTSYDQTAMLWAAQAAEEHLLLAPAESPTRVLLSPSGDRVLWAGMSGTGLVRSLDDPEAVVHRGHTGPLTTATFLPDGLLTASWDGTVRVWNRGGDPIAGLGGHDVMVTLSARAADATRWLTASHDGVVHLWDAGTRSQATRLKLDAEVTCAAFSPTGAHVATGDADGVVTLWSSEGEVVARLVDHDLAVSALAWAPDGSELATGSGGGRAVLWSVDGTRLASLDVGADEILSLAFAPDGAAVLTTSAGRAAVLWDPRGAAEVRLTGHAGPVVAGTFSVDGTTVLTASEDGTARLWDRRGRLLGVLDHAGAPVRAALYRPDDERIVTLTADGTVRTWLVGTEDLLELADRRVLRSYSAAEARRYRDLLRPSSDAAPQDR